MFGVKRFHLYLFGRHFEIYTDHQPLLGLLGESKGIQQMSYPPMQRGALALSAFSYTLKHIRGPEYTLADTLSRLPIVDNSPEKAPPFEVINLLQNLQYAPINRHDSQGPVVTTSKTGSSDEMACLSTPRTVGIFKETG